MKKDRFEGLLKQKLDGAEITPPKHLWASIESSMELIGSATTEPLPSVALRQSRRHLNRRVVWGYASAAVVLMGVIMFGLNITVDEQTIAKADISVVKAIEDSSLAMGGVITALSTETDVIAQVVPQVALCKAIRSELSMVNADKNERSVDQTSISVSNEARQVVAVQSEPEAVKSSDDQSKAKTNAKVESQPKRRVTHNVFAEDRNPKRKERSLGAGLYALNFGAGSSSVAVHPTSRGVSDFMITEVLNSPTMMEMRLTTPELKHKIPVSFGVALNFNLTERLSLETGLIYTGLTSEAMGKGSYGYNYKIKQRVHYLGIPVSVRYKVIKGSLGSVYVKGGGMIERAVSAERTETISDARTTSDLSVRGVQPSINAAVGAELNLGRKLGLYFEPGVAYYFNANQPESYRSANPVNLTLSAGLRINFR